MSIEEAVMHKITCDIDGCEKNTGWISVDGTVTAAENREAMTKAWIEVGNGHALDHDGNEIFLCANHTRGVCPICDVTVDSYSWHQFKLCQACDYATPKDLTAAFTNKGETTDD